MNQRRLDSSVKTTEQKRQRIKVEQIRVRLSPWEREILERKQKEDWQEGRDYAETLSSWIRYQLEPYLTSSGDKQLCQISIERYRQAKELAQLLGKSPEDFIAECICGIENRVRHTCAQRPLIVAEWRLRKHYRES